MSPKYYFDSSDIPFDSLDVQFFVILSNFLRF